MSIKSWIAEKIAGDYINDRIVEAVDRVSNGDKAEPRKWERLSKKKSGDLTPRTHRRHLELARYLYFSSPLARRMLEYQKVFIIGNGINWTTPDKETREVLKEHWTDRVNDWKKKQGRRALELSLWGEQIYPVFINEQTGRVKLGSINPRKVDSVKTSEENSEERVEVEISSSGSTAYKKTYRIIQDPLANDIINTDGKENYCFYFSVNDLSITSRGYSDLLCLEDWLDAYENIVFDFVERSKYLQSFLWDVEIEQGTPKQIKNRRKELETDPPESGSFLVHSDREKWDAMTPDLKSQENIEEARHIRNIILSGMGFPEYYFASGRETTRATALAQGDPTLRVLEHRQLEIKSMVEDILLFQAKQAQLRGMIDREKKITVSVELPELAIRNYDKLYGALSKLVQSLSVAVDRELVTRERSIKILNQFLNRAGFEFDGEEDLKKLSDKAVENDYQKLGRTIRRYESLISDLKDKENKEA
jgi:hypothetical protein